ncbi:hypothetical protein HELRODRAFT_163043 [Helobdella robusta]|uniref:Uncharacterized protein n=1 Tax=Helobdella robusta TaxID=6412 RepID=T1ETL5_HELRO|nr:hypothetical protein HELRODRAFT_163043 [Helobdella robusta]ESN96018.1 hypothetical protein HELRODRAFT_163043 [Helobdella robusta]
MPSAGAVSPPVIVALVKKGKHKTGSRNNNVVTIDGSAVTNNRKNKSANNIYKDTYIELTTDTPECKVFFTVDNSKPLPYSTKCLEGRSTFLYQGPFLLKSGRRIVKAVAATRDGLKTSFVTTKTFNVQSVAEEADDVNEYNNKNLESNNNSDEGYDGRPISAPTNVPMARSVSAYSVNDRNMQYNNNFYPGYNNNNYNNNNVNWNMSYVGQNLR